MYLAVSSEGACGDAARSGLPFGGDLVVRVSGHRLRALQCRSQLSPIER